MNIFYSNLEAISFQNNNTGGIDYTMIKAKMSSTVQFQPASVSPKPEIK
jgi:hypothetical protein